jgi:hypothetical protein
MHQVNDVGKIMFFYPIKINKVFMYSQFLRLTVICNSCFWLTMLFRYLKAAQLLNPEVLNTIIVLGMVASFVNIIAIVLALGQQPVQHKQNTPYFVFNAVSLLAQIVSIILYFI